MKRILHLLLFIFGFILFLLILSIIFKPKNNTEESGMDYPSAKVIFSLEKDTIDVFYIGSSFIYSSISPVKIYEKTGVTGYDLSYPSQNIFDSYSFLNEALNTQRPKLVIFEPDYLLHNYSILNLVSNLVEDTFPVIKYHNRWKSLTIRDFNPEIEYTNMNNLMGFKYQKEKKDIDFISTKEFNKVGKIADFYFDLIKKKCDDINAKLVIMTMPSLTYDDIKIQELESYSKKKNVDFIDLNKKVKINWNNESIDNGVHLDSVGAYKVSEYISDYLIENFEFENHKSDPKYAYWNDVLKSYIEEYE